MHSSRWIRAFRSISLNFLAAFRGPGLEFPAKRSRSAAKGPGGRDPEMRRPSATLLLLAALAAATPARATGDRPHDPCRGRAMALQDRLRLFFELRSREFGRAWPGRTGFSGPADFVIVGHGSEWDADGTLDGGPDTLVVPTGARVRWHRAVGLHTITDGRGLDDPEAGRRFDYLLDDTHADFDTTFTEPDTIRFFCAYHEPDMRGVLVISTNASVDPVDPPLALRFSAPPVPNPARSVVTFAVGLPRTRPVKLDVRDVQGREIAALHRGDLAGGEHVFRWRGTLPDGSPARSGVYFVWLTDGDRVIARRFSLLR